MLKLTVSKLLKRKYLIFVAVLVLVGGYMIFSKDSDQEQNFVTAKLGNIVQEVSVTGIIKPLNSVDLAFEKNGRIVSIETKVGNRVLAGQIVARIDDSELTAQLNKAEADLGVNEAELEKAKLVLQNYYDGIEDVINDAYTKSSDAVRKQIDDLFSDDETVKPELSFNTTNSQTETSIEFARLRVTQELNVWLNEINTIQDLISEEALVSYLKNSKERLSLVRNLLDLSLEAVINSTNLTSATIATYKTNINTARTNINTALSSINSREQDIASQKTTINSKIATVLSYEASAENIKAQIQKTVLRSPISGTVSRQDASIGEIVTANEVIVSVISAEKLNIEANVPEADLSRIKVGNSARVTLDAYGEELFEAVIVSIDPAEKIIDGVATYKTTFLFKKSDSRIKPGMTANIDVLTASKENVIVIPRRSVFSKDGKKFVSIYLSEKENEEREVQIGLAGSDGNMEIISGLEEGEKIISTGAQ